VIERRTLALLVAAGFLIQLPGLFWDVPNGKAVTNALRILDGDMPYRDFWTMYAPGHFYLAAVLFKLFGVHIWVQGVAAQLIVAADAAILFVITRRLGLSPGPAVVVNLSFVATQWQAAPEVSSYSTALLFLLAAIDRTIVYTQQRRGRSLVAAGVLCGLGAWFKHDVAFYVAVGIVAGLSLGWMLISRDERASWVPPGRVLWRVAGSATAAVVPLLAFLAWNAAPEAWHDLIVFPATDFRVVMGEPYPPLWPRWDWVAGWLADPRSLEHAVSMTEAFATWLKGNVTQVVFLAAVVAIASARRLEPSALAAALVAMASMPLFWGAAHVQQNTHFLSLWIFSVLLGALVWSKDRASFRARTMTAALYVLLTGALFAAPARAMAEVAYFWQDHRQLDLPAAAGVRLPRWKHEVYQPIVSFIREHVPESEPIYVGVTRHDAIVISNQAFYYLAGRPIASRYNELHPGIADRRDVQLEIIGDLERQRVRCAVLWDFGWPAARLDALLADRRRHIPGVGATLLDEYFRREFRPIARHGEYVVMWRHDLRPPLSH
jgi:hypothetical protein